MEDQGKIIILDAAYVGYCDGVHLVINTGTGLAVGNRTGCVTEAIGGTVARIFGQTTGVTYRSEEAQVYYSVIRNNRTWTHYYLDGSVLNSGTWVPGPPAAARLLLHVRP